MSKFIEIKTPNGLRLFNVDRIVKVLPTVMIMEFAGKYEEIEIKETYVELSTRIMKLCNEGK